MGRVNRSMRRSKSYRNKNQKRTKRTRTRSKKQIRRGGAPGHSDRVPNGDPFHTLTPEQLAEIGRLDVIRAAISQSHQDALKAFMAENPKKEGLKLGIKEFFNLKEEE